MKLFISFISAILIVLAISFVFKIQMQNFLFNTAGADQIVKEANGLKKDVGKLIKESEVLKFIDVPKKNKTIEDNSVYNDVLSRQSKPFGDEAGRHINVHETAHGIHSDLRNEYQKKLGYKLNAFYCLKGKAVILKDPNITIRDITKYIPKNLRSYRYNLYFVEQLKDWNDVPTYVLDEWNAYILGSECAVEDFENGIDPKSDAVSGCLDFSLYAIAMSMAVKELDPNYWKEHPEFKEFIKYNLKRAETAFYLGKDNFKSSKQEKLLNSFLSDKESDELRSFMKKELGDYFLELPNKCGQAEIEEDFEIECSFEKLTNFIENNKKEIMDEINVKLLEDLGDGKIKLKRQNNRGKFVWIAKESIQKNDTSFFYKCNLIEPLEGGIQQMNSEIIISKIDEKICKIKALMSISVEDINSKDLKMDMKMKCRRIKKMLYELESR